MLFNRTFLLSSMLVLTVGLLGCEAPTTPPASETADQHEDDHGHDHGDHGHASEGPHGGPLIELGNNEYHAEVVHDESAGSVTIYILDSAATKQVPIESAEISINAVHDGQPVQHKLPARPDEGDPEGKSSRFVSSDADLVSHLHEEEANAKLVVSIKGKSYRGTVVHGHDHGHAH